MSDGSNTPPAEAEIFHLWTPRGPEEEVTVCGRAISGGMLLLVHDPLGQAAHPHLCAACAVLAGKKPPRERAT